MLIQNPKYLVGDLLIIKQKNKSIYKLINKKPISAKPKKR